MKLHFPFLLWDHPKIYPIPIEVGGYVYDMEVSSRDDLSECAWKCRNVDVYSQAKKVGARIAMRVESLLLAALLQLVQVGIKSGLNKLGPEVPSEYVIPQVVPPPSCFCDCHCHTDHLVFDSRLLPVICIQVVVLLIGFLNYCSRPPLAVSPSPRRRGHGVITEGISGPSSRCVLQWRHLLARKIAALAFPRQQVDDLHSRWWPLLRGPLRHRQWRPKPGQVERGGLPVVV